MKYIRTEDNKIYLLHEDLITKGVWWFETKEEVVQISYIPSDLGKVADTIEELCDEFVYETNYGNHISRKSNKDIVWFQDDEKPIAYFGAVWTDKGLIYVAKMNEEGVLELL